MESARRAFAEARQELTAARAGLNKLLSNVGRGRLPDYTIAQVDQVVALLATETRLKAIARQVSPPLGVDQVRGIIANSDRA